MRKCLVVPVLVAVVFASVSGCKIGSFSTDKTPAPTPVVTVTATPSPPKVTIAPVPEPVPTPTVAPTPTPSGDPTGKTDFTPDLVSPDNPADLDNAHMIGYGCRQAFQKATGYAASSVQYTVTGVTEANAQGVRTADFTYVTAPSLVNSQFVPGHSGNFTCVGYHLDADPTIGDKPGTTASVRIYS